MIEGMQLAQKITGVPMPRLRASPGMMKAMSATMGIVEKLFPVPADGHEIASFLSAILRNVSSLD
jgi:hypothetical protein